MGLVALVGLAGCGGAPEPAGDGPVVELSPPDTAGGSAGTTDAVPARPEGTGPVGTVVDDPGGEPHDAFLTQVARATRQAQTGRVRVVDAATPTGSGARAVVLKESEITYDNNAGSARMRFDLTGARQAGDPAKARVKGPGEILVASSAWLIKVPGAPAGGWVDVGSAQSSALSLVFDPFFKVADMRRLLSALECAGPLQGPTPVTVDGVAMRQVRVSAPARDLAACAKRDGNAGRLILLNLGDAERATVDLWVDDASLVRRVVVTGDAKGLPAAVAARYPGTVATTTVELSGFGERVDLRPPPADQIRPARPDDLLELITSGLGDLDLRAFADVAALGGGDAGGSGGLGDLDELLGGSGSIPAGGSDIGPLIDRLLGS